MSTADTALSISIKMAPGPEHRQEPVAPDKIAESDRAADAAVAAVAAAAAADVVIDIETVNAVSTSGSSNSNNNNDDNNNVAVAAVAVIAAEQSSNIEIAPANFAAGAADSISQSSPLNSGADSKQVSIAAATASRKRRFSLLSSIRNRLSTISHKKLINHNRLFFSHRLRLINYLSFRLKTWIMTYCRKPLRSTDLCITHKA